MAYRARGFEVARIAGVKVRLDWSLLIVVWLIMVNLGMGLFPVRHPEWSAAMRWGVGAVAAVLFLLSILAHELAHALVGRARGVKISEITLFIFGGMAHMRGEPRAPRDEVLMTIVGPLTSIVIGVVAVAVGAALSPGVVDADEPLRAFQRVAPVATVLLWLGPLNVFLGLFNLIPAFPLDGGRILRAALWARTRNFTSATRAAARVSHLFALLFIFAGVSMMFGVRVPFLGRGFVPGLWIAFIGWFLNSAATASTSQVIVQDLLEEVPVARLMRGAPIATVPPDLPIATLVDDWMMAGDQRAFPVVEGDALAGIVTPEDVRKIDRGAWPTTRVRDVMTAGAALAVATPDTTAADALMKLSERDVEQLPVVAEGRLVGMLRRRDILRWLELQPRGLAQLRQRRV